MTSYSARQAVSKVIEYGNKLSQFTGVTAPGAARKIFEADMKERVLLVAVESGAATVEQAEALARLQWQASFLWPNIRLIFKAIP